MLEIARDGCVGKDQGCWALKELMGIGPTFSGGWEMLLEVVSKTIGKDVELFKAGKVVKIYGSVFVTFHPFEVNLERQCPEKFVYQASDIIVCVSAFCSAQSGGG